MTVCNFVRESKLARKVCPQCGGRFLPNTAHRNASRQIFCGVVCRNRHTAENKPRATDEERAASRKAINARYWQKRKQQA